MWRADSDMKKPSYKKLWKLMIDRDLKKKDLQAMASLSPATIVKLSNHENVSMDILLRVCDVLQVDVSDIMEFLDSWDDI
jgi:DNA-binding Xre family transcriptional regulator